MGLSISDVIVDFNLEKGAFRIMDCKVYLRRIIIASITSGVAWRRLKFAFSRRYETYTYLIDFALGGGAVNDAGPFPAQRFCDTKNSR